MFLNHWLYSPIFGWKTQCALYLLCGYYFEFIFRSWGDIWNSPWRDTNEYHWTMYWIELNWYSFEPHYQFGFLYWIPVVKQDYPLLLSKHRAITILHCSFFFVLISWIRSTIFSHQYGFRKHPTTCLAMIQVVIENITSVLVKEKMNLLSPAFLLSKRFFLLSLMIYAELP